MAGQDIAIQYEASLLRNIVHNTSMGIVETDLDFRIRLYNRSACRLLNDDNDVVGMSMRDLLREKNALEAVARRLRAEEESRVSGKWTPDKTKYHTEIKMVITLSRDNAYMVTGFLFMCEELPFYTVCCLCRKVRTPDGWISLEELMNRGAALSHTYCPDCMPGALAKIQRTV